MTAFGWARSQKHGPGIWPPWLCRGGRQGSVEIEALHSGTAMGTSCHRANPGLRGGFLLSFRWERQAGRREGATPAATAHSSWAQLLGSLRLHFLPCAVMDVAVFRLSKCYWFLFPTLLSSLPLSGGGEAAGASPVQHMWLPTPSTSTGQ